MAQSETLRTAVIFIATLCVLPGCIRRSYQLHLVPEGKLMRRTLTVTQEPSPPKSEKASSPLSEAELANMRKFYDSTTEQIGDKTHTFEGSFRGEMPGDVGGAGRYEFFESPLGSTSLYTERFRLLC